MARPRELCPVSHRTGITVMTEGVSRVTGMSLPRVSLREGLARGMGIQGVRPRAGRRIRSQKACL